MDVQQQGQQPRQILYARKLPSKTSHYVVSLEQSDLGKKRHERSEFFVGKLRRSEGTKEYVLYGPGANPNDLQGEGKDDEMDTGARSSQVRDEHCCIVYNLKRRENQGVEQRKMEVVIPSVLQNGERTDKWRSSTNIGDSIFDVFNHVRFKVGVGEHESEVAHAGKSFLSDQFSCRYSHLICFYSLSVFRHRVVKICWRKIVLRRSICVCHVMTRCHHV